jgi:hypothetical protein
LQDFEAKGETEAETEAEAEAEILLKHEGVGAPQGSAPLASDA